MEPSPETRARCAPAPPSPGRRLIGLLYTNNPLYLISAWLVFSGLRASFSSGAETYQTWALLGGLAGYTLLLAAAACLLIRLGRVWEDVRTLLLLVLLMFLAISVSLDEALTTNATRGSLWLFAGFAFSVAVSETLRIGLGLRLPVEFRLPCYLILALFFLYPVVLAPWVGQPSSRPLQWGLFAFPTAAGLAFLTLLPGIRRGARLTRDNGTPWSWPWYPLSLFVVLAVAVCLRAYYLCLSLHFVGNDWSIFGAYFLVPFLAAVNVLLLEVGLAMRARSMIVSGLVGPVVWLWLSQAAGRDDVIYARFLHEFRVVLYVTPLFATLVLTLAFFLVATCRRVPGAKQAGLAVAAAMSLIGPRTTTLSGPFEASGWALIAVAGVLTLSAARQRASLPAAFASLMLTLGSAMELRGTWFTSLGLTRFGEIVPLELLLAALLTTGAVFRDGHARFVRFVATALLLWVGGIVSAAHGRVLGEPGWLSSAAHLLFWTAMAVVYAHALRLPYFYWAAAFNLAAWGSSAVAEGYGFLRTRVVGLREISLGLAFFVLAFLLSVWKTRRDSKSLDVRREVIDTS